MAATIRSTMFLALTAAMVLLGSTQARAQNKTRLVPPIGGGEAIPRLGFDSYFDGCGERVTAVHYGSPAWELGIEPGDKILAVNGVRLRYDGHWYELMGRAAYEGHATLAIRDWRSGQVRYRTIDLGGGNPITPKSRVQQNRTGGISVPKSFVPNGNIRRSLERIFR